MLDLPRLYTIREHSHRILNPITSDRLASLGAALQLVPGSSILDLACGKGELLCTWAREHAITGTGVDISTVFLASARERAAELDVAQRVRFVHGDAGQYVSESPVDVASCCGATWIGNGLVGTMELLERSLRPGGIMLIGEPYLRNDPTRQALQACFGTTDVDYVPLPDLVARFHDLGWDVIQMFLADQEGWDRYVAAGWFNMRRWLDANPHDDLAGEIRAELTKSQLTHARYQREHVGWGIFALLRR